MPNLTTQSPQTLAKKPMASFVFLSLILILLCFFIFLFSISSFEQSKVVAVGKSFHTVFAQSNFFKQTQPSYEANAVQIYHQEQIKKIFSTSSLSQNADDISVSFDMSDIFKANTPDLTMTAEVWFRQLKSLTNAPFFKKAYRLEMVLFEDLKASEPFPIFPHLTTRRLTVLTEQMDKKGIEDYSVRITKGNAARLVLSFKRKDAQ